VTQSQASAEEAHRLMVESGYLYLDVRTPEEFAQGHPQDAFNVPLMLRTAQGMLENPQFLQVVAAVFAPDQKLIVGCQTGNRSATAVKKLAQAGYQNLVDQRAGFGGRRDPFGRTLEPGWKAAGLPCATEPLAGRDYDSLLK
jgi:rhodanese-related sulfurtransferase